MTVLLAMAALSSPVHLYVGPHGDDAGRGTVRFPLRTFDGARLAARKFAGRKVVVEFMPGVYRLSKPVVFGPEDSGDVLYRAKPGAEVAVAGSVAFRPNWRAFRGGILQTEVPTGLEADQIYLGGRRQILARYPNADPSIPIFNGYARDAIAPERVAKWQNPHGAYFHAMHGALWGDFHYRILGKNADGTLKMEGGWQNNRPWSLHEEYRFVEGVFEELDAPREWFLDRQKKTLYYFPGKDFDRSAEVEAPVAESLVEFRGCSGIALQGFVFRHALRTFMKNKEPLLRSDWTIYRGGAAYFKGTSRCEISDCTFENLGGNAVFADGKNRDLAIRRCLIREVGASGVCFVGDPKAVRNPLLHCEETQSYAAIDHTPGPKTDDFPLRCAVEDCLITRTGREEKQTAGVQISMASEIAVRHCSIYEVPRAGINIGDGCWGGHIVEGCDVFDTVLETGDHGSFNSWGRDRYWNLTDVDMNKGERPDLAALDTVKPITLRNNRWRCDHGWDIDLDDGSSRYVIVNNLCLSGGLKNREGFDRLVENNVMVGNSFHPHVWFHNSGDVFRRNIVFGDYRPIGINRPWGKQVDCNFLHVPGTKPPSHARSLSDMTGQDERSMMGDARFVDPAHGDFTVERGSPALELGFRNFPMNAFGVQTPRLKAIARRPGFIAAAQGHELLDERTWMGAKTKNLLDLGEISATGSEAGKGVLVLEVGPNSAARRLGLQDLDVILQVDRRPVASVTEFLEAWSPAARVLTVWRRQRRCEIRLP